MERFQHRVTIDGQRIEAHTDCVVNRVGDGRRDGRQGRLADALRAERTEWIIRLDQNHINRRIVTRRRNELLIEVGVEREASRNRIAWRRVQRRRVGEDED